MYGPLHSEVKLLEDFASGERTATAKIYSQHFKIINGWIMKNGGGEQDAADLFQEAMVVMFEKAQAENFRLTCKIGTYLFAISKHLWYKRKQQQYKQPGLLPDGAGAEDGMDWAYEDDIKVHQEREIHYSQLDASLDQLGEPCRSLLKAFYHHDKSMVEIAANFGYTNPENAKTQKYKCLTRLRKIFHGVQAK